MVATEKCSYPANHTSIESSRSEDSNGVWYVFSRAHSAPIEQESVMVFSPERRFDAKERRERPPRRYDKSDVEW